MQIKDILREKGTRVATIDAGETIHAAIVELNRQAIGSLLVTDEDGEIAGIITERDVMRCCGENCTHLKTAPPREQITCPFLVKEVMTKDLVIGIPDDDLNYVMGIMTKHHIRHLPILDNGSLAGIISISDLVNAHLEENVFKSRTLKDYVHTWGHSH